MKRKEREFRLSAEEKINEIKSLKEEVKNKENELLIDNGESKIFKLFADLEQEKHKALHDITALELKLIKFGITPTQIDKIKKRALSF